MRRATCLSLLIWLTLSLLLEATFGLSTTAHTASTTRAEAPSVEDLLVQNAVPIEAANTKTEALEQLFANGVCRINGVVDKEHCSQLKDYLLSHLLEEQNDAPPQTMILNTRLNCGSEPLLIPLNHRTDVLVPLQNSLIRDTLQHLIKELGHVLENGVQQLLPPHSSSNNNNKVQLLEAASLISTPGATHQTLHPDFRRDAKNKQARLPPRLVAFLYLQDTPTIAHGPTIFLARTNTRESHRQFHTNSMTNKNIGEYSSLAATLSQGDVAIYDASVLHFGSANKVEGNTRAVFYFGVGLLRSRKDETTVEVNNEVNVLPPVTLSAPNYSWSHPTLSGYKS